MTWLGSNIFNLKDQITTLTKEVLADSRSNTNSEESNQERIKELTEACEEKDKKIDALQQEIDLLRNNASPILSFDLTNDYVKNETSCQSTDKILKEVTESENGKDTEEELIILSNQEYSSSSSQNDEINLDSKQVQYLLQRIETTSGRNRLNQLYSLCKEVKKLYDAEKSKHFDCDLQSKIKMSSSAVSLSTSSSKNSHVIEDTMSNDSKRSDDSLLNDFEILKPKSTSIKNLEDFSLSHFDYPVNQNPECEVEISSNKNMQNFLPDYIIQLNSQRNLTEFKEIEDVLDTNLTRLKELHLKVNEYFSDEKIIHSKNLAIIKNLCSSAISEFISKNDELKNYIQSLVQENKLWKQFYMLLYQNDENPKQKQSNSRKHESCYEMISVKNALFSKYMNKLLMYNKKIRNFNLLLNEVSIEILNKIEYDNHLADESDDKNQLVKVENVENEDLLSAKMEERYFLQHDNYNNSSQLNFEVLEQKKCKHEEDTNNAEEKLNQLLIECRKYTEEIEKLKHDLDEFKINKSSCTKEILCVANELLENRHCINENKFQTFMLIIEKYFNFSNQNNWVEFLNFLNSMLENVNNRNSENSSTFSEMNNEELHKQMKELEKNLQLQNEDCVHLNDLVKDLEIKLVNAENDRERIIAELKIKNTENISFRNEFEKMHSSYIAEVEKSSNYAERVLNLTQKIDEQNTELERLRKHLLSVEQSYTNELIISENQIKELTETLQEYEKQIKSINADRDSVKMQTNKISEILQDKIKLLSQENEELIVSLNNTQSELQKAINDGLNLHSALDLFYKNRDSEIFEATQKLRCDMQNLIDENEILKENIKKLENNLEILNKKSMEQHTLENELKNRETTIENLEKQVANFQKELKQAETKITELKTDAELKLKLNLLKNVVFRYVLSDTDNMKLQALQIMAEVLDFSIEEKRKIGLFVSQMNTECKPDTSQNDSLIDEFIRFVEKESSPKTYRI